MLETAAMFGLGLDDQHGGRGRHSIIAPCEIPLPIPGPGIVFITGPSGGGKSTLLRLIGEACESRKSPVIRADRLPEVDDEAAVVDLVGQSLTEANELLSLSGLSDAFIMLRRSCELSDGQRSRLQLARVIQAAQLRGARGARGESCVILADEFGAALDRLTAQVIARNVRRWIDATSHTFIAATTHDDLLEALQPEVLIYKGLGDGIEIAAR